MLDLFSGLPALRGVALGRLPVAGPALQVGQVSQQVGQRAVITLLPGGLQRSLKQTAGLIEAIGANQALADPHRRAFLNPRWSAFPLKVHGPVTELEVKAPAHHEIRVHLLGHGRAGQSRIARLLRQHEPSLRVPAAIQQVVTAGPGEADVDAGLQQPIGGGICKCLLEHGDGHHIARVVQQDLGQDQQRLRPGRPRRHLLSQRLKVVPRPGRVARAEQVGTDVRPPPPPGRGLIQWGERRGQFGQFRGGGRSPAGGGRPRRLAQSGGGVLVGPLRRQREMPRPFLRAGGDLAQPAMRVPAPVRRRPRVDRRGKQRVGEPDPGTLELDHTLQGSRLEGGPGHRAIRPFEHRGRRRPQARGRQQDTLDIARQRGQPRAQYPLQVGGHGKRFPRWGFTPNPVQCPGQL